jgi:hypothetical protein
LYKVETSFRYRSHLDSIFYSEYIVKQKKYLALVLLPLFINPVSAAGLDGLDMRMAMPQVMPQEEPEVIPQAEPQFDPQLAPQAEGEIEMDPGNATQRFADRCTDFTTNGWAFKAPRNFLQWLDAFTDPAIYLEFAQRGMDPQSYVRTLSSLLDPGTPKNYLEWSNPEIYNQWAQATAEPEYYTAVNSILFDPGRLMRWVMLPLDERAWNVVGTALNPNTWLNWLNAPNDPRTQALFAKAADPETSRRWLEALVDPNNTPWWNLPSTAYGDQPVSLRKPVDKPRAAKLRL